MSENKDDINVEDVSEAMSVAQKNMEDAIMKQDVELDDIIEEENIEEKPATKAKVKETKTKPKVIDLAAPVKPVEVNNTTVKKNVKSAPKIVKEPVKETKIETVDDIIPPEEVVQEKPDSVKKEEYKHGYIYENEEQVILNEYAGIQEAENVLAGKPVNEELDKSNLEVFDEMRQSNVTETVLESESVKPQVKKETKKEEKKAEKHEKINKDSNMFTEKIFITSENPLLEQLENFKPDLDKVVIKDIDDDKMSAETYMSYFDMKKSPAIAPRITRIPLLLSGYYAEMRAYNGNDMFAVERAVSDDTPYSIKLLKETQSLFNHINWDSEGYYKNYDVWAANTFEKDLDMLYFGAKDATFPGKRKYNITCGCGNEFDVDKDNKDLNVIIQRGLTPEHIIKILKNVLPAQSMKELPIYQEARSIIKKELPNKYLVELGLCSVRDFIEWVTVLEEVYGDLFDNDLSVIDDPSRDGYILMRIFTYITRLALPVPVGISPDGKQIIGYRGIPANKGDINTRINNKRRIILFLSSDLTMVKELLKGKDVRSMWSLSGIKHKLHGDICPACKAKISVPIVMRERFFDEAEQLKAVLSLRNE